MDEAAPPCQPEVMEDPEHIHRPYCLRCYARMESYAGTRRACERCGYVNLKIDQQLYWTREKRLRELEGLAKTLIVAFLIGLALLIGVGLKGHRGGGMGQGWAIGFPVLIVVILWDTASKITRYKPYFRATIVWRIIAAVFAVLAALLSIGQPVGEQLSLYGMAAVPLGIALFLGRIGRALARWRDRRILAGQRS
jgi:ribosomal protein L40E